MNYQKNSISFLIGAIAIITVLTIGFETNQIYAEESKGYKIAEDVKATLTFHFRDAVETHEFPVFSMTSNFVSNSSPTFQVRGVVDNGPHLHKALDESFKYRSVNTLGVGNGFDHNYRFFDVDVDFTRADESFQVLHYTECEIISYHVETLNSNDYESYFSSKSGFAIVDIITFDCGGLNSDSGFGHILDNALRTKTTDVVYEYPKLSSKHAENVRAFLTFQFDNGIERIQFPIFQTLGGFGEGSITPEFKVEGIVNSYPLLNDAIGKSRQVFGIASPYNADFDVKVEFIRGTLTDGEQLLRAINYNDCIVDDAKIVTQFDKEEGFTGKRGFATVQQTSFSCEGMNPENPGYEKLYQSSLFRMPTFVEHTQMKNGYNMGTGPHAIATFNFDDGKQTINFPIYKQSSVLSKANPSFELEGIIGDYPLLYKRVDDATKINQMRGASITRDMFNVQIAIKNDENLIREFSYNHCRVLDYVVKAQQNKEESYFKGHALTNKFNFECQGYHPSNPIYSVIFDTNYNATILSSLDLRDTQDWSSTYRYSQ